MKKIVNGICVAFGFIMLGLGGLGIVLPVLPATPFFLASGALFAKGSQRFHRWFIHTKLYKKHIQQVVKNKTMTKKAKRNVTCTLCLVFSVCILLVPVPYVKVIIFVVAVFHLYYFLVRIKTIHEQEEREQTCFTND